MKASVVVSLKDGVLDPQGAAIHRALAGLGFASIDAVRQGKIIEIDLATDDPGTARAEVDAMCARLLANPVIETYHITLSE